MQLITCVRKLHSLEILEIFNDVIANSTAIYEYKPRAYESMVGCFDVKEKKPIPHHWCHW
jgi:L-amino acid N-acyltransferase